ncbi:MAG: hypothetical protein FH758_03995 [Firmicutes bacterium]|nr:hypothetical protein [Bacillota bacterium]
MFKFIKGFWKEEKGGVAENAALIVMILIIVVGLITFLGGKVKSTGNEAGSKLDEATNFSY